MKSLEDVLKALLINQQLMIQQLEQLEVNQNQILQKQSESAEIVRH